MFKPSHKIKRGQEERNKENIDELWLLDSQIGEESLESKQMKEIFAMTIKLVFISLTPFYIVQFWATVPFTLRKFK